MDARARLAAWLSDKGRNDAMIDVWSGVHLLTGLAMGWVMEPFIALLILVLWEPLEIFVLSPLVARLLNAEFGFETLRNALSDIVFDVIGVALGLWVFRRLVEPPFILFG